MLVGIDGSKALRKAVLDVLDHPVIQRCQLHYADLDYADAAGESLCRARGLVA